MLPEPTLDLRDLLYELHTLAESDQVLGRYMAQVQPLGADLASARSRGVRIMGMGRAKGLTPRATIVVAVEDNLIPRPEGNVAKERRLLYVAMTRARTHLFITWARRRRGPTAWSGKAQMGERRNYSPFLDGGPVDSTGGPRFLRERWPRMSSGSPDLDDFPDGARLATKTAGVRGWRLTCQSEALLQPEPLEMNTSSTGCISRGVVPVIGERIPFPGSGQRRKFEETFSKALEEARTMKRADG